MKHLAAIALLILPLPALAEECGRWTAEMPEDEGGPVMTAHVCKGVGNAAHELSLTCNEASQLWMRFLPVAPTGYPPDDENFTTKFKLSFGQESVVGTAHYEAMDGAMVLDFASDAPMVRLLQSGKEMVLADLSGKVPGVTFSLKGSKVALATVLKSCGK